MGKTALRGDFMTFSINFEPLLIGLMNNFGLPRTTDVTDLYICPIF